WNHTAVLRASSALVSFADGATRCSAPVSAPLNRRAALPQLSVGTGPVGSAVGSALAPPDDVDVPGEAPAVGPLEVPVVASVVDWLGSSLPPPGRPPFEPSGTGTPAFPLA